MKTDQSFELNQRSKISLSRLLTAGLIATGASTAINLVVANILRLLFNPPAEYAPLTFLPIFSGCLGGSLGAVTVFGLLAKFVRKPFPVFYLITGIVLIASYSLPLRLLNSTSPRFAGHTPPILVGQMIMHTIVALSCLITLKTLKIEKK